MNLLPLAPALALLAAMPLTRAENLPTPPILPKQVYGLKGKPCVIQLGTLVYSPVPGEILYDATGPGAQYNQRLLWHPKEPVKPLQIGIYAGRDFRKLAELETTLQFADPAAVSAQGRVRWLAIGDSLTLPGHYIEQTVALLGENVTAVTLEPVGTQAPKGSAQPRHEGRGGWSWQRYLTGGGANAASPFVFEGNFDFSRYVKEHLGGQPPEVITIFLGANDVYGISADFSPEKVEVILERARALVGNIRQSAPKSVIGILPPPPPSEQNGFGTNYQNGVTEWQYRRAMQHYTAALLREFDGREQERLYIVPGYLAFDPATAYPLAAGRAQNALHPLEAGFQPISVSLGAWLIYLLANGTVTPSP